MARSLPPRVVVEMAAFRVSGCRGGGGPMAGGYEGMSGAAAAVGYRWASSVTCVHAVALATSIICGPRCFTRVSVPETLAC